MQYKTSVYGIAINSIKEKELVRLSNDFLRAFFSDNKNSIYDVYKTNRLIKHKYNGGIDDPEHPENTFVYEYSYDYFNKYLGVNTFIYTNRNKNGETQYDENIEWIIKFVEYGFYIREMAIDGYNPDVVEFIHDFLEHIGVNSVLLELR